MVVMINEIEYEVNKEQYDEVVRINTKGIVDWLSVTEWVELNGKYVKPKVEEE